MQVSSLLSTNAGDEHHLDENWQDCPSCGYDNPADYSECTFCGAALEQEVEA